MRSFLENNSVVDAATGRTQSQFTWQPGDLAMTPFEGSVFTTEETPAVNAMVAAHRRDQYNSLVGRDFPIRRETDSLPTQIKMHPDELQNQIAHRMTYHNTGADPLRAPRSPEEDSSYSVRSAHINYKGASGPYNVRLRHAGNFRGDHIALDPYEGERKNGFSGYPHTELYDHLDRVTNHPTIRPMSLYRGFGRGLDLTRMRPGTEFVDHGYTGLTHDRSTAMGFAEHNYAHPADPVHQARTVAMVHIPAGTHGHALDLQEHGGPRLGSLEDEQEFLLHRGTHFRVMGHSLVHHVNDRWVPGQRTHVVHLQVTGQHALPLRSGLDAKERGYNEE